MNHKERIIKTIKGERTDCLPFVPRLDLWYRANKKNGTLPIKYRNATLMEMTLDMDIGYHGIVPDFKDIDSIEDEVDRALGIYKLRNMPYRAELKNVERKVTIDGDITQVDYITPVGNIRTKVLYNEDMRREGITITHIVEHAIKSPDDFEAMAYIFNDFRVSPNYEGYNAFNEQISDRGVAVGFVSLAASPMHLIQRELMPVEQFFYEMYDHNEELNWLSGEINNFYTKVFQVVAESQSEIVLSGANYDSSVTYPPFFKEYIAPYLKQQADILHKKDKFLLTHTDGENKGLLDLYLEAGIDIADSICPYPMTKLSLEEVRNVFKGNITIWGGLPSICVLENSMSEYEFEKYLNNTLESVGKADHLILSLADTTPPLAKFERIEKIIKLCKEFGPVVP